MEPYLAANVIVSINATSYKSLDATNSNFNPIATYVDLGLYEIYVAYGLLLSKISLVGAANLFVSIIKGIPQNNVNMIYEVFMVNIWLIRYNDSK